MERIVKVSCIRHVYPDRTAVHLCGLDMVVDRGDRVAIVGPNGGGKSTMLHHIIGLLRAHEGEVDVFGVDPARDYARIRERVGVVLQNAEEQIIAPTVRDDVSFSPRNYGYPSARVREMVDEVLAELGIAHLADRVCHYLSGGEKRKVALAGALVTRPELVILDEPFEGLDPRSKHEMIDLLNHLHDEHGLSIVYTTHEVNIVPLVSNRVYVVCRDGVIFEGTPEQTFAQRELLEKVGLEQPTLAELSYLLGRLGVKLDLPSGVADAARMIADALSQGARITEGEPQT
ncbi:MAG TPA: energy-coupling factor ABC transporter ATP-binding protein [Armatimonadota bacterium]|nr:energy-coupling factor ABC transporter ATP-binding protein [Armatimonadota bacterium]